MVHLVLDDTRLEPRRLDEALVSVLVVRADANVYRPLDVHGHTRDRQAPLLERLDVLAPPLELGIDEGDQRRVATNPVDEQALRDSELRRRKADADRVAHDPGHPLHLLP